MYLSRYHLVVGFAVAAFLIAGGSAHAATALGFLSGGAFIATEVDGVVINGITYNVTFAGGGTTPEAPVGLTFIGDKTDANSAVNQIDAALNRLALAAPQIKKNVIEACVYVVGADGVVYESEAELLRAVADTLDCPMPPLVTN